MRIIDRRNTALGHNNARTRNVNDIRRIGIHHSVTPAGHTTANFENWWRNPASGMGNPAVGGYHEVILQNGDVELNFDPNRISHGVGNQNADSYHICIVGNFRVAGAQPTAAQMRTLMERIRVNVNRFANVTFDRVLGHNEFPGHGSNTCPGLNMNTIRNQARNASTVTPQPTAPTTGSGNMHRVTARTGGFITAADALNNRNRRTWVEPGNYHVFNRANGMINVSTRQGAPGSWINPNEQQVTPTVRVGSRVRVNANAQTWATGQNIPNWVRGQTYTVQQLRSNNREALLAGVMSWIRVSDVTLV